MKLAICAVVIVCAGRARAGMICMDPAETDRDMAQVEAFAKHKASAVDSWLCPTLFAKDLAKRIERACTAILDRDGDASPCVKLAAAAGFATLGSHDIFTLVATDHALDADPVDSAAEIGGGRLELFAAMGDPRAAPLIVAAWNAATPRAAARERHHGMMTGWSSWRQRAAAALGAVGGAADASFLAEQAAATVDTGVRRRRGRDSQATQAVIASRT